MKKFAVATAALALAGSAHAADLAPVYKAPVVMPFSWTGLYIGVNAGVAQAQDDWNPTGGGHLMTGGLAGGTIGYNWQVPATNWVLGVEGDIDWADINGSAACPNPTFSCQSKMKDMATLRGRLGYAAGHFLIYGTGGAAWSDYTPSVVSAGTGVIGSVPAVGTRTGWVAGGGFEYAFWQNWSFKGEVLHFDLGSADANIQGVPFQAHTTGNLARAGLNFRF